MMPTNEIYIEKSKNKFATWETQVTVEYEPATVSDLDTEARWFKTVGEHVVAVRRVKVSRQSSGSTAYVEQGFEVDFACGAKGYVTERRNHGDELDALVVGTAGYLHGLAVFRKHRFIVGSPTPWFRAQKGKRARMSPERAPRCCAAELYARAAGKPWG